MAHSLNYFRNWKNKSIWKFPKIFKHLRKTIVSRANAKFNILRQLDLTMFGEGVNLVSRHDKMVQDTDVHQGQRLHQRPCQQQVRLAGRGGAGRVVMGQHDRGGISRQGFTHHFPGIDAGMGLSTLSAKKVFLREQRTFCNSRSGSGPETDRKRYTE